MSNGFFSAVLLLICLCASAVGQMNTHEVPAGSPTSRFHQSMSVAMDKMHHDMSAAPTTGDVDRDFLAMMIPHHGGAVEMARLVLIYGKDPLVRQLAEEIIAGQQAEIAAMQARFKVLDKGPDPSPGGFPALGGTRGN